MDTKLLYRYHNNLQHKSKPNVHQHPFYQIEIITQGSIYINSQNNETEYNAPAIVIIPPNIKHTIAKESGSGEAFSFKIQTDILTKQPQKIFAMEQNCFTDWFYDSIVKLARSDNYSPTAEGKLFEYTFSALFIHLGENSEKYKNAEPELFRRIREFTLSHGRLANIDTAAEYLGCSSAHLKYIFRKTAVENPSCNISTSPKDFIDNVILEMIERYLKYSDMPISQIAKSTQFPDIYKLSRFYCRMRGISPLKFRNSTKNK